MKNEIMKFSDEKFLENFESLCKNGNAGSVETMLYHLGKEVIGLLEEIRDQGAEVTVSTSNSNEV